MPKAFSKPIAASRRGRLARERPPALACTAGTAMSRDRGENSPEPPGSALQTNRAPHLARRPRKPVPTTHRSVGQTISGRRAKREDLRAGQRFGRGGAGAPDARRLRVGVGRRRVSRHECVTSSRIAPSPRRVYALRRDGTRASPGTLSRFRPDGPSGNGKSPCLAREEERAVASDGPHRPR